LLSQFHTPYCTDLRQYGLYSYTTVTGERGAVRMTMHRWRNYSFPSQLLRQKNVSAYNIATVCCNSHVQENELSSDSFTSIRGKTISWLSEFRTSLQNFRVAFWHPKTA